MLEISEEFLQERFSKYSFDMKNYVLNDEGNYILNDEGYKPSLIASNDETTKKILSMQVSDCNMRMYLISLIYHLY